MEIKLTTVMYHYVRPIKISKFPGLKALDLQEFKNQISYFKTHYNFITTRLQNYNNICTKHGFQLKFIKIIKINSAEIYKLDYDGQILFNINYNCLICDPNKDDYIKCTITHIQNNYRAEYGPLEIIVLCQTSEKELENIDINDKIIIKILKIRKQLLKKNIKVIGLFIKLCI